jgi:ribosomal protein L37E
MGENNVRWECPQCGYLLFESDRRCSQCGYLRTPSDRTVLRDPEDTNSWVLHRLDAPAFERVGGGWDWRTAVAVLLGIGIAVLLILLLSLLGTG